jgi:hypothetical protein
VILSFSRSGRRFIMCMLLLLIAALAVVCTRTRGLRRGSAVAADPGLQK